MVQYLPVHAEAVALLLLLALGTRPVYLTTTRPGLGLPREEDGGASVNTTGADAPAARGARAPGTRARDDG
jgi:hypothetical protein